MRALVTGATGLIGSYLCEHLLDQGDALCCFSRHPEALPPAVAQESRIVAGDISDRTSIAEAVRASVPDWVFHLAAQSLPGPAWTDPAGTVDANVLGTIHLLDAVREAAPAARVLVAGSSAAYAPVNDDTPISESYPLEPGSPYGVSKGAADHAAKLYAERYDLDVLRLRPFFLIGPRKKGDALSDFARGVVAVERGEQDSFSVGNLDPVRDFLDVRDGVRAIRFVADTGRSGEAFNICSGKGVAVRDLLDRLCSLSGREVRYEVDPARCRPLDEPVRIGDPGRVRALGWEAEIPLEQTLADTLEYWRTCAAEGGAPCKS